MTHHLSSTLYCIKQEVRANTLEFLGTQQKLTSDFNSFPFVRFQVGRNTLWWWQICWLYFREVFPLGEPSILVCPRLPNFRTKCSASWKALNPRQTGTLFTLLDIPQYPLTLCFLHLIIWASDKFLGAQLARKYKIALISQDCNEDWMNFYV